MLRFILAATLALIATVAGAVDPNNFDIRPGSGPGSQSSMIRPAPTYVNARVLAANTAESATVPTGANWVLFSSTCNFYANPSTTATVPAADVTNGSSSELNPSAWGKLQVVPITAISVIAGETCVITLSFYY